MSLAHNLDDSCSQITLEVPSHERVVRFTGPGVEAYIAVHSTALGPALGGCRIREYASPDLALKDVLKLSEGMSYKNALAEIPFGGGKACVLLPREISPQERRNALELFGTWVNLFEGNYITAEDMGTTVEDIMWIRKASSHVCCLDPSVGGVGDPSPWTVKGLIAGLRSVLELRLGQKSFKGVTVGIEGIGKTGSDFAAKIISEGATVYAFDYDSEKISSLRSKVSSQRLKIVSIEELRSLSLDIFSPCAVGQTLTEQLAKSINASIIAGTANNQLSDPSVAKIFHQRGIIYCPDFAINAGGAIVASAEMRKDYRSLRELEDRVSKISATIRNILLQSSTLNVDTDTAAKSIALSKLHSPD